MPSTVVHVEVETEADGALAVRWELAGAPTAVEVAVGPTPELVDHRRQETAGADQRSVRLTGLGPARHYVSVGPAGGGSALVAADRRVVFEGLTNFRDLGGYPTASGGRVRWGRVFRGEALHGLTTADMAVYDQLGMRSVYDLRGDAERDERPNPVPTIAHTIAGPPAAAATPGGPAAGEQEGEGVLHRLYLGLIDNAAPHLGELYAGLVRDGAMPAVFHCHAGKDRTGVAAALLLEALGVDRELVLDDYELTARYRLRSQQESSYRRLIDGGMSAEAAAGVLSAPRWAMAEALDDLDRRHGGIESYLLGPAGMQGGDLAELRRVLVAPPG